MFKANVSCETDSTLTDDLICSIEKKKKWSYSGVIKHLWCVWNTSHHVFASAVWMWSGVKKAGELFAALSREPEDKSWLHQNFSEGGDNVSC